MNRPVLEHRKIFWGDGEIKNYAIFPLIFDDRLFLYKLITIDLIFI